MSSARPDGWAELVQGVRDTSIAAVAASIDFEEPVFRVLLIEAGESVAANAAPWWPEALRMREGGASLRSIAARFGTDPRRIRRALAREGLRVKGVDLSPGEGVPALEAVREQLGNQPDVAVARAAKVIPEAVHGERRRLDVSAYFQRRRVKLTADDEAWIRGPKKVRRERFRPEPESLQVVRRPMSAHGFDERVAERQARRPEPGRSPGFLPRPVEEVRRRDFFRSDGEKEIALLTQPSRLPRDGNRRIVRADGVRGDAPRGPDSPRVEPPRLAPPVELPGARTLGELPRPPSVVRSAGARPGEVSPTIRRVGALPSAGSPRAAFGGEGTAAVKLAPEPAVEGEAEEVAWHVFVPGSDTPIVVYAADIAGAVARAGERVPANLLSRSAIWRADEAPSGGGWSGA